MRKRIGIYGGSFDPIHIGHLIMAEQARQAAGLDEVWFIPASNPPHKEGSVASSQDRLAMVERAVAENPYFRVSRVEMEREGPSYTVDTLRQLVRRHQDTQFYLVVGADMVLDLPHWYNIEEITETAEIIGLVRPGVDVDTNRIPEHIKKRLTLVDEGVQVDLSSTWIRERAAEGGTFRYLVPEPVRQYMEAHRLYESR
ncbi:MAG: nicotinate-nucleotide adenylyltransferase [Firmicutes bacterium]|uniref:Probable nicotinate-nucleotide adenylyltransferase n=1 Tax=Melghirimyces thermohalophilus TaxID=1236220 RepID=A0A1G6PKJ6_9BACL|nr:nicotinate-nucleotide adenylyltransferase [Melghirimyces thermohalophilus]MDA8352961.1 nicotinate-nucleotide adenylyltransferase [Bacillota bacterium]SDC80693.1 nicotinate-nucleotide adenylyltransferase [Melghirimyces thermohalophilus]